MKKESVPYRTQPSTVRVIYVVPIDSEPWGEAKHRATEWLEDIQWFFADQMERLGYGPKTFEIAKDKDGALIFEQINSPLRKEEFIKARANNCKSAAESLGLRSTNDIVVYFHESYSIISGEIFGLGARGGQRNLGGEAFLSSLYLKVARREWIADDSGYNGAVFDWISPEPLKDETLRWNKRRGRTLGDVSGSAFGVMGHELGHCFGLSHDKTDDRNGRGNLMGTGCLGMRGYFRPDLTDDFCVLSERNAAILDKNSFFAVRKLKPKSASFF